MRSFLPWLKGSPTSTVPEMVAVAVGDAYRSAVSNRPRSFASSVQADGIVMRPAGLADTGGAVRAGVVATDAATTWTGCRSRSADLQQHLADVAALLQQPVRVGGLIERQHAVDDGPDLARLDRRPHPGEDRGDDGRFLLGRP